MLSENRCVIMLLRMGSGCREMTHSQKRESWDFSGRFVSRSLILFLAPFHLLRIFHHPDNIWVTAVLGTETDR